MNRLKKILRAVGPGFITGASDDDPSGILTYAQTGAQFGYKQLWVSLFSLPFMISIQEMCGRIGIVTGKGLASVIRMHYGRKLLSVAIALLFVANTVNIGADLGAMAASAELVSGLPFLFWLLAMSIVTLVLVIVIPYPIYARVLKWLTLSLFAYVVTVFLVKQDWSAVAYGTFVPHIEFNAQFLMNIVALFGTTISPYLFFWQADEEVEEEVERGQLKEMGVGTPKFKARDITNMRWDTALGMIFSNLVAFFVILTAASTLHANGIFTIETAADGARALEPIAGSLASTLFALGIIGTGMLAVPVLAGSAAYAVSESLQWKEGLSKKWSQAKGFYLVIILSTLIGVAVNFSNVPPFRMLYASAVLNGVTAPVLMVFIILIANNKKIMGKHRNTPISNILGWMIAAFMGLCAVAMLGQMVM